MKTSTNVLVRFFPWFHHFVRFIYFHIEIRCSFLFTLVRASLSRAHLFCERFSFYCSARAFNINFFGFGISHSLLLYGFIFLISFTVHKLNSAWFYSNSLANYNIYKTKNRLENHSEISSVCFLLFTLVIWQSDSATNKCWSCEHIVGIIPYIRVPTSQPAIFFCWRKWFRNYVFMAKKKWPGRFDEFLICIAGICQLTFWQWYQKCVDIVWRSFASITSYFLTGQIWCCAQKNNTIQVTFPAHFSNGTLDFVSNVLRNSQRAIIYTECLVNFQVKSKKWTFV